jgi:hypothetical protein
VPGDHETAEQPECHQLIDRIEPFAISVSLGLWEAIATLPDTQGILRQSAIALHRRDGHDLRLVEKVNTCHGQTYFDVSTSHQTSLFVQDNLMEVALMKIVMALGLRVLPCVRNSDVMSMAITPAHFLVI